MSKLVYTKTILDIHNATNVNWSNWLTMSEHSIISSLSGADPGFYNGGRGGGVHEHEALSPLWPVTRAAYGSASSRALDGLSSEPEFKAFWFKNKTLSIKIWKGGGGGGAPIAPLPRSTTVYGLHRRFIHSIRKSKTVNCKRCTTQQQYQGLGRKLNIVNTSYGKLNILVFALMT